MPIVPGDIDFYLSGGAANADVNASLGGAKSSVQVVAATLHNLFDRVTGDEGDVGDTEYRCIYVQNNHATLTLLAAFLWVQTNTPSTDTTVEIALGGEGSGGTAETVANENTAPVGETFSAPATKGAGLSLGDLAPGGFYPIWIKRIVSAAAAAYDNDGATLRVEGDTAA